ncbi:EVE domain-containing protein [Bacillus sp. DNRA2]|uniref:EVE domain-containing protein n=1 Tax=Bacillus sp. DNRA2 TaxID=2723053 RepID=UPI00145CC55A|nr:EVE domain-containing protein [Bacillus sp. DNRA2]NMD71283.1 EVE domain-containing protein [Bacillus sp. DNRA2]
MEGFMFITTPENWEKLINNQLGGWPIKDIYKKSANKLQPGDKVLVYLSKKSTVVAILEIVENVKIPRNNILFNDEYYHYYLPYRIHTKLTKDKEIYIKDLLSELTLTKGKKRWGTTLQKSVVTLVEEDYLLLLSKVEGNLKSIKEKHFTV